MLVINLGPKALVTDIEKNKQGISLVDALEVDMATDYDEATWVEFFARLEKEFPDLTELPLYIIVDAKMGVLYKTFSVTNDVFADIERQRRQASSEAEKREILTSFLMKQLPVGLEGAYSPSIPRSVNRSSDVLVTCAYLPTKLISTLIKGANRYGVQIFDIMPGLRALYGAFDAQAALGFDLPCSSVLLFHHGALVWTKPKNWVEEDNYRIDQYFRDKLGYFDLENLEEALMVTPENMAQHLNPLIKRETLKNAPDQLTAAMCCGAAANPAFQERKETSYVLNRIRKFFK